MNIDTAISVASDHIAGWLHLLIGLKILTTKGILPRVVGVVMVLIGVFFIPTFAVNVLGLASNIFTIIWGAMLGVILLAGKTPLMNPAQQPA